MHGTCVRHFIKREELTQLLRVLTTMIQMTKVHHSQHFVELSGVGVFSQRRCPLRIYSHCWQAVLLSSSAMTPPYTLK